MAKAKSAGTAAPAAPAATELAPVPATVQARVLMACQHGRPDDVVTLGADLAALAAAAGEVDTTPAAVAYALTLPQNQPAA